MKTLGVIGGLGPETTAKFYLEIVSLCYQKNKISRPPILLWSVPIKLEIEEDLITKAKGEERYLTYLVDAAQRLEAGGADFIAIPCNSVHIFIEEIRTVVRIPVLSIVEETVNFLKEKGIKRVGILATSSTLKHKIYQSNFERAGIDLVALGNSEQQKLGEIINNLVLGNYSNSEKDELMQMISTFSDKGTDAVILACTNLQLVVKEVKNIQVFDTMKILAGASAGRILT